jgi:uncharacterized protein (TIGR03382 family)
VVPTLQPGDTLHLAGGTYTDHLVVDGLNGRSDAWITVRGPDSGPAAVFLADPGPCCNTIEIRNSSYVAFERLTVDGNFVDGAFGLSAKGGTGNRVHDIRVEGCTFLHHDTSQQNVALSTKTPTWGWVIRGNRIVGAGTGMYLGNSNGADPFVAGLIEGNLIQDTIGYNIEIKWQQPRPVIPDLPAGPSRTVIRHNVFIKTDRASPDGDRPNLLVGGFPDSGTGVDDLYEVYGNLFFHNPREALMQASGRVSIHDNLFLDASGTALRLADHDLPLKLAWIYNNTIVGAQTGISVGSAADQGDAVVGNLIFADTPTAGTIGVERDNLSDVAVNAGIYLVAPALALPGANLFPLPGKCTGSPLDLSTFADDQGIDQDFNGCPKGARVFRGAYAGEGQNPGWPLAPGLKILAASCQSTDGGEDAGPDAGQDAGQDGEPDSGNPADPGAADPSGDSGQDAGPDPDGSHGGENLPPGLQGSCSCAGAGISMPLGLVLLLGLARLRRRFV